MLMKSYVVIGLGLFGSEIATRLYECGEEVIAIDTDEQLVNKVADRVTRAITADARDQDVLERLGIAEIDHAIVAVGTDLAASALITMNLKNMKVPSIICKAQDNIHREILERLGADRVIIPEREMADKLVLGMTSAGVMEYIELSDQFGITEMKPVKSWVGKSIRSLQMRTRYGVNIIALRDGHGIKIPPDIETPLEEDDTLVILGSYDDINRLKKE